MRKLNASIFYLWCVVILLTAFMVSIDYVTFEEGIYVNTLLVAFRMLKQYAREV